MIQKREYRAFKKSEANYYECKNGEAFLPSTSSSKINIPNGLVMERQDFKYATCIPDYIWDDEKNAFIRLSVCYNKSFIKRHCFPLINPVIDIIKKSKILSEISQNKISNWLYPITENIGKNQYKMSFNIPVNYSSLPFEPSRIQEEVKTDFIDRCFAKNLKSLDFIYPVKNINFEVDFENNIIIYSLFVETEEKNKKD